MQAIGLANVKMCARRAERRAREIVMGQLPKWQAIQSGILPQIQVDCPKLLQDEFAEWDRLYLTKDLDGLMQRMPHTNRMSIRRVELADGARKMKSPVNHKAYGYKQSKESCQRPHQNFPA
jgi:hypothetical protein